MRRMTWGAAAAATCAVTAFAAPAALGATEISDGLKLRVHHEYDNGSNIAFFKNAVVTGAVSVGRDVERSPVPGLVTTPPEPARCIHPPQVPELSRGAVNDYRAAVGGHYRVTLRRDPS